MSYKDELKIDKFNLDVEWQRQPELYMKWAEKHAQAIEERDKADLNLKVVTAKLFQKIKENYQDYGFNKVPSDGATNQLILLQPEYIEAHNKLIEAKKNVSILAGAKESFDHRKKALENMTQLWVTNYYAEPRIEEDAKEISRQNYNKEANSKLTKKLKRR